MTVDDIDLWELNEAFASQVVYCRDRLGIPMERLNVNGGSIAIGHPFGMTGSRLVGTLANEMVRRRRATASSPCASAAARARRHCSSARDRDFCERWQKLSEVFGNRPDPFLGAAMQATKFGWRRGRKAGRRSKLRARRRSICRRSPRDRCCVRNLFMSVDPYMRGRMNDVKSYVPPFQVGRALEGGAIGEVVESHVGHSSRATSCSRCADGGPVRRAGEGAARMDAACSRSPPTSACSACPA